MKGYIQVYTGDGKGKTTAALGLALRAVGAGKKVYFAQFIKDRIYSEIEAVQKFLPDITVRQYGLDCFIVRNPTQEDIDSAREGFEEITAIIQSGKYEVVVLDEANIALFYNLFTTVELIHVLQTKPENVEIVLTGRYAPMEIIQFADLVTEMKDVKLYYYKGVEARVGIEF